MDAIIALIINQVTIWGPAITAIIGIVITLIKQAKDTKASINEIKSAAKEIRDEKSIQELVRELQVSRADNEELKRQNKLILEQLTKVKNYDTIKAAMKENNYDPEV